MQKVKEFWNRFKVWWSARRLRVKVLIIALIGIALIVLLGGGKADADFVTETAKRQDLDRTVAASGVVVSSTDLSLSFESTKMVDSLRVVVGTKVKKGDIIATQKNASERATYQSARGGLLAAQARYDKVLQGNSNEEVALAKVQLQNALRKLYSDDLIADPQDASDTAQAPVITGTYTGDVEGEYRISFDTFTKTDVRFTGLEKGTADVDVLPQPLGAKGLRIAFPSKTNDADASWKVLIPNKSGPNYTANKALVEEKEAALALTRATARQPEIDAALADIVSAQAQVDAANASLEKTILRAPADGTITRVDVKVGEVPDALKPVIVLQDVSNLYLEANINETSVALLSLEQPVAVTFDAFGSNKPYQAAISSIDPSATIVDSIVNYKIKALLRDSENIRPGMTANMTISAAHLTQVLTIPGRALTHTPEGAYTVDVLVDARHKKTETRTVEVGLRGDGDVVEIKSGLTDGDQVVWSTK